MKYILLLQLLSGKFSCRIEMKSSGYYIVPTRSVLTFETSCVDLGIQVKGKLPEGVLSWYREYGLGSFYPYIELKNKAAAPILNVSDTDNYKFVTLQEAVDYTPVGGTLLIPEGHYYETVNISYPIRLVGTGEVIVFGRVEIFSSDVVLDNLSIFSLDPLQPSIIVSSSNNVTIHNCRLEQGSYIHSDLQVKDTVALYAVDSFGVTFVNNKVIGFGTGLKLRNCTYCVLQSNWIQFCWTAFSSEYSEYFSVAANVFIDNAAVVDQVSHPGFISSLLNKNVIQEDVWLTNDHDGDNRDYLFHSTVLERIKFNSTVIITGSCEQVEGAREQCAFYQSGM